MTTKLSTPAESYCLPFATLATWIIGWSSFAIAPDADVHAMLLDTVIARQAAVVTTTRLARMTAA